MNCSQCGTQNPAGFVFCQGCGHRLHAGPLGTAEASGTEGGQVSPGIRADAPRVITPLVEAQHSPRAVPTPAVAPMPARPMTPTPAIALESGGSKTCSACSGACDVAAQFCKFCGKPFLGAPQPPMAAMPGAPQGMSSSHYGAPFGAAGPMHGHHAGSQRQAEAPYGGGADMRPNQVVDAPVTGSARVQPLNDKVNSAKLALIAKDGSERERFALGEVTDIGRSEGEIRFADDRYLSPRHARVSVREGGRVLIEDLASTNGTFARIRQGGVALVDQDLFLVGQQVVRFELLGADWYAHAEEHGTLVFGTPAGKPLARLAQVGVEGVRMNVFYIRANETVLGRESGDWVFTDDPFMSRRHAIISRQPSTGTFTLSDVGSSNGTFVRIRRTTLVGAGDEFRVGQQLFRVHSEADA